MFHVISLKIINFMKIKNKTAQSFCRNGFHLWLDGSFQFENYAHFSETPYPSSTPTENNHMGFSPVRLVVMKILPQIVQDTVSLKMSWRKCSTALLVWGLASPWWNQVEFIGMLYSIRKGRDSALSKLR